MPTPAPVTFTISHSTVHQVTLELDVAHQNSKTIKTIIDGIPRDLDDCHVRMHLGGIEVQGGSVSILVFGELVSVVQMGHVIFSGTVSKSAANAIVNFILSCRLPTI